MVTGVDALGTESISVTLSVFQIEEEQEEKGADRLLFSYLTLLTKLCKHCGLLELREHDDTLRQIWGKGPTHTPHSHLYTYKYHICSLDFFPNTLAGHIEAHLRYPHCWVWLTASQLFGQLFAAHQAEQLVSVWRGEDGDASSQSIVTSFITNNLDKKVKPGSTGWIFLCLILII